MRQGWAQVLEQMWQPRLVARERCIVSPPATCPYCRHPAASSGRSTCAQRSTHRADMHDRSQYPSSHARAQQRTRQAHTHREARARTHTCALAHARTHDSARSQAGAFTHSSLPSALFSCTSSSLRARNTRGHTRKLRPVGCSCRRGEPQSQCRCGRGEPRNVQIRQGWAQPQCTCGMLDHT